MRYAIIEGGKVANVVLADPEFALERAWIAAPDDVGPGYTYAEGLFSAPPPPEVDPAEAWAAGVKEFDRRVTEWLDGVARGFGYGDPNRPEVSPLDMAAKYAGTAAVSRFQAEAQALLDWCARVWDYSAAVLYRVENGERPAPTADAFMAELAEQCPPPTQTPYVPPAGLGLPPAPEA